MATRCCDVGQVRTIYLEVQRRQGRPASGEPGGEGRSSPLATGWPGRQAGAGARLGGAGRGDFVFVQVDTGRLELEVFRPR
jgi:hypothetical protein